MGVLISDAFTAQKKEESKLDVICDWLEFRIDHLKKRILAGEESAYIRLTEVEALKDYIERDEFIGEKTAGGLG